MTTDLIMRVNLRTTTTTMSEARFAWNCMALPIHRLRRFLPPFLRWVGGGGGVGTGGETAISRRAVRTRRGERMASAGPIVAHFLVQYLNAISIGHPPSTQKRSASRRQILSSAWSGPWHRRGEGCPVSRLAVARS